MTERKTWRRLVPRLSFSGKTSPSNQLLLSKEKSYNQSRGSQILSFTCLLIDFKPTSEPDAVLPKPPEVKRLVLIWHLKPGLSSQKTETTMNHHTTQTSQ